MTKKWFLIVFLFLLFTKNRAQSNEMFNDQAFGKGSSSYYIGSGAFKRHLDLNKLNYSIQEYSKSPALVIGADYCIHPTASNAYFGLGPYFSSWLGFKKTNDNNQIIQRTFSSSTLAVKLTHHASYFVRKKLDVCSGYIVGCNLKYYHNYKVDGVDENSPFKNSEIEPAFGITLTIKYYMINNFGIYLEGGIGYKVNMLNVGFCYKFKKKRKLN